MAIGTRLRKLGESITEEASHIYKVYDVGLQPRWFPVFYVLSQGDYMSITAIANEIGHSHVSVSQIVKEMKTKGLVTDKMDDSDGRKTLVALSGKGRKEITKIQDQYKDVGSAVEADRPRDVAQAAAVDVDRRTDLSARGCERADRRRRPGEGERG